MDKSIIGIGIALGLSFFILYSRKKVWLKPKIVWTVCGILFVTGVIGLLNRNSGQEDELAMYYGLCVPIIYWTFDRIFRKASIGLHKRDFILYMRNSDEINSQLFGENPHVKASDKLFSFGLLVVIVGALLIGLTIL